MLDIIFPTLANLTGDLDSVPHSAGPPYGVEQRTAHVAPEVHHGVGRGVAQVLVQQAQAAPDHLVHHRHTGPADVPGVHHLHPHAGLEVALAALRQLEGVGGGWKGRWSLRLILIHSGGAGL